MTGRHSHLARSVADAAAGLSDRDRELLDLTYRHGLDVGELAVVLGLPPGVVRTRVVRLRQTLGRHLGPLLAALGVRNGPAGAPAFLPAPDWLRNRTLNSVRKKVCDDSASDAPTREGSPAGAAPLRRRFP